MEHIIRDYRKADNQGLAVMWNESQSAWPTGFGGNVAFTAERVAEDMKKQQALFYLVAEDRGRIVGYCWVSSYPKEPDACYVALLNAHPAYHGKGVGKGLLMESIRRAVELGYYRVDLHTWPSNIKAVPLYKKTGFFWLPDTQVHMQNYIPAVLAHPLAKDFFAKRDWYATFVRELDQEPDEVKVGKRRVFPYRFQDGGEFVEVVIDMESRRVCAVETDKVKASLVLNDPEVVVGRRYRVEINGRSDQKRGKKATWLRPKNKGLRLEPAGDGAILTVDPEVAAPEAQMPSLTLGARMELDGIAFTLEAGIRPKQPVDLEWHPKYPDFSFRERVPLRLTMANNTGKRASVSLEIRHQKDVRARLSLMGSRVEKDGKTGCLVDISKTAKGVGELLVKAKVRSGGEELTTKRYRVPLFNIGYGQKPVLWHDEHRTVWETPGFRAEVIRRGGEVDLTDKASGRYIASIDSSLGPPFWPNEFANIECQARMQGQALVVSSRSQRNPGMIFQRVLEMVADKALRITSRVINGTRGSGRYQVSLTVYPGGEGPRARKVFPLKQGCIGVAGPHPFGGLREELPRTPEGFSESWWAAESEGFVTGVVWDCIESVEYPGLVMDIGRVKPGDTGQSPAVTVLFGPGDHSLVRRWYLERQRGQSPEDYRRMEVIPRINAAFDPPVLFLEPGKAQRKTFMVSNLSNQEMPADLEISLPGETGIKAHCPAVKLGQDFPKELEIQWNKTSPGTGTVSGRVGINEVKTSFGIVRFGGEGKEVRVDRSEEKGMAIWTIDNGLCRFKASPQFLGSLFSWVYNSKEHILSSFPKPGNFSWERPWYGGIAPALHPANSWGRNLLIKERFTASQTAVKGRTGLVWRGVKMSCRPADKKAKGLLVEISYLTLPSCPVMAVVTSFRNTTSGCMHFGSEAVGFVSPGGGYGGTRLRWDECGHERTYLRGDKGAWAESEHWGAAENPETGETVIVAIPRDQSTQAVLLMDYGRDGGHLGQAMDIRLKAKEAKSFLALWGVAGCAEEALALRHLAELEELP